MGGLAEYGSSDLSMRSGGPFFVDLASAYTGVKMDKVSNTFDLLAAALQAEALRQKTIASNIANAETPGYRRVEVKFEELLAKEMDKGGGKVDVRQVEPEVYQPKNTPVKSNGNDVNLELEVGNLVKNSLRHETLARLLAKKVRGIDKIINTR